MSDEYPDELDAGRHRDLAGRVVEPWARRGILLAIVGVIVLALLNVFGQEAEDTTAAAPTATVTLNAPDTVRGGLLFQARIEISASSDVDHPRLVFDRGWLDGMQINTIEPSAVGEASRDGRLVLSYDTLAAGDHMTVWIQFQADPTYTGRRSLGFELDDADTPVARLNHTLHVLP
jgi:hypothetical protein